jgi:hypothetical protein
VEFFFFLLLLSQIAGCRSDLFVFSTVTSHIFLVQQKQHEAGPWQKQKNKMRKSKTFGTRIVFTSSFKLKSAQEVVAQHSRSLSLSLSTFQNNKLSTAGGETLCDMSVASVCIRANEIYSDRHPKQVGSTAYVKTKVLTLKCSNSVIQCLLATCHQRYHHCQVDKVLYMRKGDADVDSRKGKNKINSE